MTLEVLEKALKSPVHWKRSEAMRQFLKEADFGIEALPLLEKAIDDEDIVVILAAIECIGKLGPKVLTGESADINTPRGLVAKLLSLGNQLWDYSGYKNCYSTSLQTLVKLGYTNKFLFEYIRNNLDLEGDDDFVDSLAALRAIGSPEALDLLKQAAESRLPELNKKDSKKVQTILAKAGIALIELPKRQDWYTFHTLDIKTGELWAGDPQLANADDGLVVKVPLGKYVVECDGLPHRCKAVSKLRVRLESAEDIRRGKKLGETGTDSAAIGVCEISAFEDAYKKEGGGDAVQRAIESETEGFGVVKVPEFPGVIMPFVPTGSDGTGPVFALVSDKRCVGIELVFMKE
jgi:hypothetical protein